MNVAEKLNGDMTKAEIAKARRKVALGDVLTGLKKPKIAAMLGLGFSSGLPFLLIGATLSYWLGDAHVNIALIGYLSWVGMAYSLKFIWGAVVDNLPPPLFARLGKRRGWMLWMQALVAVGLIGMATCDPHLRLQAITLFALLTAFAAATQDVVIDAWRIEIADDGAELDLLTAAYKLGYQIASIMTASIILLLATWIGWRLSYAAFGVFMGVGLAATLFAKEPVKAEAAVKPKAATVIIAVQRGVDAAIGPFFAFFKQFGPAALVILLFVSAYHICDYVRGPVINPFYVFVGLQKAQVAAVRLSIGLPTTILGIAAGGLFSARFGQKAALVTGAVIQPIAVAAFAVLVLTGPNLWVFSGLMAVDDFCMNFAGVTLIVYMSGLTQIGYTATQYALLTSALAWSGKFLKGFSGQIIDTLSHAHGLAQAYSEFFIADGVLGVVAIGLCFVVSSGRPQPPSTVAPRS